LLGKNDKTYNLEGKLGFIHYHRKEGWKSTLSFCHKTKDFEEAS